MSDQPPAPRSKDPLHGITLERIVTELSTQLGWVELGRRVPVRCFLFDPSIKSSLTFLRKTPWARAKVEGIYLESLRGR
jgi:uncharacterized protein (DUF2132 family)